MPTKTDRILSTLPETFRALPKPTALYSLVDAFGNELQGAENSLAAIMLAHWVDHADRRAELIRDLACIAALYGLAPRGAAPVGGLPAGNSASCPPLVSDETVEEFREHLKRYIRTFLEGTATVQGVLRVAAEALALRIADAYPDLDTWWSRKSDVVLSMEPRREDAAQLLFGVESLAAAGQGGQPARLTGAPDLGGGVDLRTRHVLRVALDGGNSVDVDLWTGRAGLGDRRRMPFPVPGKDPLQGGPGATAATARIADLSAATLDEIAAVLNGALSSPVASHDGSHLILTSPSSGADSRVEIQRLLNRQRRRFVTRAFVTDEASQAIFGFITGKAVGKAATRARVEGKTDLSRGVDLRQARFLRVGIDGLPPIDVDCAQKAERPRVALPDEIAAALESVLGSGIASHDGRHLVLTSPSTGAGSRITLGAAPADDARALLLGDTPLVATGSNPAPAVLTGKVDLLAPVNLAERPVIRLAVDGGPPVDLDVGGPFPESTSLQELASRINAVFPGMASATEDDRLSLASPTAGEGSSLEILPLRSLDLVEYPPHTVEEPGRPVHHGDGWTRENGGAAEGEMIVEWSAPQGVFGPGLANLTDGWGIRVLTVIRPGGKVLLWRDAMGDLCTEAVTADGESHPLPESSIVYGPLSPEESEESVESRLMTIPGGRSRWLALDCAAPRFDQARFNGAEALFAGGVCRERGLFNVSRFTGNPGQAKAAVFAPAPALPDPPVNLQTWWRNYRPGAFMIELPEDLPEAFGGRFNQARFGKAGDSPEVYEGVVMEPDTDPDYLVTRVNAESTLVTASFVDRVPLGWEGYLLPLSRPRVRKLTGGRDQEPARLYLAEDDVPGFIELKARQPGAWGNGIAVTARKAGPARFQLTVGYQGARFECARQVVLGTPLAALAEEVLRPGPVGLLQARAAGVAVQATRRRTEGA